MRINVRHLAMINGRLFFRMGIPRHLQEQFGKREIKKVLPFTDLKPAALFCKLFAKRLKLLFIRLEETPMLPKNLEKLLREYYTKELEAVRAYFLGTPPPIPLWPANKNILIKKFQDEKKEIEQARELNAWYCVAKIADEVIKDEKDFKNKHREEYLLIAHEILKTHPRFCDVKINLANGEFNDTVDDIINPPSPLPTPVAQVSAAPITPDQLPGEPAILKDLYAEYRREKINTNSWEDKTIRGQDGVHKLMVEFFGEDLDLRTLTHKQLKDYRDKVLMKMPARRSNTKKLKDLSIEEALKIKGLPTLTIRTINEHINFISGFLKWCAIHEYIPKNPAENLRLKDKRAARDQRKVYDKEDLVKIFTQTDKICLKGGAENYWIPVIALYTGMRPGEICQLTVDDIKNIDGIDCFRIKTEYDSEDKVEKSVKTEAGHRVIPIHPVLTELGLLDYCQNIINKKGKRLWPKLEKSRNGKGTYGETFAKRYQRFNRNYVTGDKKKVLYSFRHLFSNCIKQHGVTEIMIDELTGHANASLSMSRYGKAYEPKILLDAILKLDFGIDVVQLLTGKPSKTLNDKKPAPATTPETGNSAPVVFSEEEYPGSDLHEFDDGVPVEE